MITVGEKRIARHTREAGRGAARTVNGYRKRMIPKATGVTGCEGNHSLVGGAIYRRDTRLIHMGRRVKPQKKWMNMLDM